MCTRPKYAYEAKVRKPYGSKRELLFSIAPGSGNHFTTIQLPCGQCPECRMQYARNWANRCLLEMQDHEHTWFVTLTYDDEHLPRTMTADERTGEALTPVSTLVPRDLQLFLKRFRYFNGHTRFFGVGEYGEHTYRPHYHLIIFGPNCQLEENGSNALGNKYYTSPQIEQSWTLGFHSIAPASWRTCAYVARYILKKQTGEHGKEHYRRLNIEPPFTRMSRNPGIGMNYLAQHPECFQYLSVSVGDVDGAKTFPLPPALRRRLKDTDPVSADWYSIERASAAENCEKIMLKLLTDKDVYDILQDKERRALQIQARLPRPDF